MQIAKTLSSCSFCNSAKEHTKKNKGILQIALYANFTPQKPFLIWIYLFFFTILTSLEKSKKSNKPIQINIIKIVINNKIFLILKTVIKVRPAPQPTNDYFFRQTFILIRLQTLLSLKLDYKQKIYTLPIIQIFVSSEMSRFGRKALYSQPYPICFYTPQVTVLNSVHSPLELKLVIFTQKTKVINESIICKSKRANQIKFNQCIINDQIIRNHCETFISQSNVSTNNLTIKNSLLLNIQQSLSLIVYIQCMSIFGQQFRLLVILLRQSSIGDRSCFLFLVFDLGQVLSILLFAKQLKQWREKRQKRRWPQTFFFILIFYFFALFFFLFGLINFFR